MPLLFFPPLIISVELLCKHRTQLPIWSFTQETAEYFISCHF
ncbi:hypothetical protein HMPREF1870_00711 [Bacteroidales bacterium KA00344]|nr:hypothetical protein HMPREF1870_00711 [Bacteroidales bacterium KA00344]